LIHPISGLLLTPTGGGGPAFVLVIQLGLIFLIFYWLLIRPQRKEREKHEALVAGLKKGDEIVTMGGIIGTVVHLDTDRVTIKTAENTRIVVERSKVARVATTPGGSTSAGS
jgi:preprotein translocase subunit YajC